MRVALCLVAVLAVGCSAAGDTTAAPDCEAGDVDGDLHLYNWPGYIDPALLSRFEEAHGIEVVTAEYRSSEELRSVVSAGSSGHDVVVASDHVTAAMVAERRLGRLNRSAIPNLTNLAPAFAAGLPFDSDGAYSVPYLWGTTGLGVDLGITGPDVPRTWGLLFDADLAATYGLTDAVTALDDPRQTMGAALKYLGHSLNTTDADELRDAEVVVAAAAARGVVFDSDGYDELLIARRTVVSHGHSANFLVQFLEVDEPDQYTYFVPDEGGARWVDSLAVVADAPSPCTAHTFIDFLLVAENGAALTNWTYQASPNAAATPFIDRRILDDPLIYAPDESKLEFIADVGRFESDYVDAFRSAVGDEGG